MSKTAKQNSLSFPAVVIIAALAIFGAVTLIGWLLGAIVGFLRFGLFIVIVLAIAAWVVNAKGRR